MIYRIIDKTTKMFLRDDVRFNPSTEIALPVDAPKFGLNSKWVGNAMMDNEGNIGHWEDTRTAADLEKIERDRQKAKELQKAKKFILEFDYVENKVLREKQLHDIDILDTKSDRINMTYREILLKKEEYIKLL